MGDVAQALALAGRLIVSGDGELLAIVGLSLFVSGAASLIAFASGVPAGALLAMRAFRGRQAALVVLNALLGMPPVVVGLAVYLLVSRSGPFGALGLLFTPGAMILAQFMLTLPIVIALAHRAVEPLWREHGDNLVIDGAGTVRAVAVLTRMAQAGLATVFLSAFGRAIAEVGAIMIVGGNIRGATRTMTTAIALETSKGDLALALALGIILVGLTLAVSALAFALSREPDRSGER